MGIISAQLHFGGAKSDPGLLQNKSKPRISVGNIKTKITPNTLSSGGEELDDVYAFPADSNDNKVKGITAVYSSVTLPSVSINVSGINSHGATVPKAQTDSGQSSLAKIYPELAEKLEKIKPKVETKLKGKGKSSRTMNSLQTKIAQNKIKDKLKRNQCSSNTSSQSQSPSHSFSSSPGYQINSSSPNYSAQFNNSPGHTVPPNVTVTRDGIGNTASSGPTVGSSTSSVNSTSAPSLSQLNLLNGLNLQTLNLSLEQLGLPVPTFSDIEQTLKQLASAANIPLEGTPMYGGESNQPTAASKGITGLSSTELQMFPQTYTQQSRPPPPYSGVHHKPVSESVSSLPHPQVTNLIPTKSDNVNSTSLNEMIVGHQIRPVTTSISLSTPSSVISNSVPQVTRQFVPSAPPSGIKLVPTSLTALSSSSTSSINSSPASTLTASLSPSLLPMSFPGHPKLTLLTTSQTAKSVSSKVQEPVKQTVTTSPAPVNHTKLKPVKSRPRSRNPSSGVKRPVPLFSLPMTVVKPRKIRKVLDEEEVKKLTTESAMDYYKRYKQRVVDKHSMVYSSIASSDESDLSDCELLPWQPDWFQESSDEDSMEEDEEMEYGLRTAKLALGRARLRRQCSQARRSNRSCVNVKSISESTNCLIKAIRESTKYAVKCIQETTATKSKPVEKSKSKGLVKRRCLYKDNEEVQCKGSVVPYANHCIKHVMYNVDQQLFEYCTAKFADNTQCCHPVIDVKHELPLCMEHGVKADNFLKTQDAEPKPKRPRKKTKPSALTRPPKKGKKKKNQRKNVRPQKPIPAESEERGVLESDNEGMSSQPQSEMNVDSDSDKGESQSSATDVHDSEKPPVSISSPAHVAPSVTAGKLGQEASMVVSDGVKQGTSKLKDEKKTGSVSQLEELENLTSLSELENVKMFGDLETASKLLEENDFQEVFNRLPDEAFDIFNNKSSSLPGTDDLQDFEDSLALANRELKLSKEPLTTSTSVATSSDTSRLVSATPLLDESDELTRQIAEEIMKQNIGPSAHIGDSMCNGDAEESIKAIARSLSNTGMMLAAEAKHKSQLHETSSPSQHSNQNVSRTQSLPAYANLENLYYPPNVAIQNVPVSLNQTVRGLAPTAVLPKAQASVSQNQAAYGKVQTNIVPQNVTVTPQGIITTHLGTARLVPNSQTVTIGNTTVTGNQTAGIITVPVPQQLTAQQLSALVQQATAHLPPLPPYTPRPQSQVSTSVTTQPSVSISDTRSVGHEQLVQQLTRQSEPINEQPLLPQQLLQQKLALLTQQQVPIKVTLSSSQNLGFSTILHQGNIAQLGRINQGVVHSIPNVGQISQLIKTSLPTSQTLCAPVSLPTTNIVWTSPPNVTITSPNGLPTTVAQSLSTYSKMSVVNPKSKLSTMKETFIDLTDSNDPPPYEVVKPSQNKSQPPSYPPKTTSASTPVPGKS
ncbi:DNA recombination [Mactra antiquata]